jgi:hypothetical protein
LQSLDLNSRSPAVSDPLDTLALRAAADPYVLAHRLAAYQRARNLTDADLAHYLGCTPEALTMVRLCRAPRGEADGAEDVRCVAERFGCDAARLAAAVGCPCPTHRELSAVCRSGARWQTRLRSVGREDRSAQDSDRRRARRVNLRAVDCTG